jgi:superoxide reductase
MDKKRVSRRNLVKTAAFTGIAAGLSGNAFGAAYGVAKGGGSKLAQHLIQPQQEGKEKHSPVIDAPKTAKEGEPVEVQITVGKEKRHPNTTVHHVKWIQLYMKEEGNKPLLHVGTFDFGPNYAEPKVSIPLLLEKTSTLYAIAYCNIHGVWESSVTIKV